MGLSIWHLLILLVVVILVFGTGKLTKAMGDIGRGVKEFKKGIAAEEEKTDTPASNSTVTMANPPPVKAARLAAPVKKPAVKAVAKRPVVKNTTAKKTTTKKV
ncbi:MAG: twin-arginine translocase TatA/TatE family subunit [Candidatus Pacebacteria bacterium]|nr:twin-arginine translocase TatA/TatE family subunit [Candidatus Paceibacterota bacterium]